ncbi:hypothetical protein BU15DRAFT_86138 [Melanogaster broomeanus]|nr:hypothetical protein BU15DRAFT_86138 [Melanogaster broomeanus]
MSVRHEHTFPPSSIGRAQGSTVARSGSRESITTHPLLSPGPSVTGTSSQLPSPTPDTGSHTSNSKYVPYTPRQRPATTSTTAQPPVSPSAQQPQSYGGATGKLQLMNLKAAAQGIGLDTGSLGWAILEKISYEGNTSEDWSEIWAAVTKGKASLLLPLEQDPGHERITPEFVKDHTIICDTTSRNNTAVVTLSGLRGQLVNDVLTLRSTLPRSTKRFQDLVASSSLRASLLAALPPLPSYPPESSYPSFTLPAYSASLPLPPRASKPPLPPRPNARPTSTQASSSRLSMPFASLFGQKPSTPPASTTPLPPIATPIVPSSADVEHIIEVSAFSIATSISRKDVSEEIVSALKAEIAVALNDQSPWVMERVQSFALPLFPFVTAPAAKKKLHDIGGSSNKSMYAINNMQDEPEELSEKFQDFYRAFEAELRNGAQAFAGETRDDAGSHSHGNERVEEKEHCDVRIRDILETIETILCTIFYDRLFVPSTSDDASHDEALSSRIAALNMLDLGLEHLDVDVGDVDREELDAVVQACGATLAQLNLASRSPHDKATVLVSAHKLVVGSCRHLRCASGDSDNKIAAVPPSGTAQLTDSTASPSTAPVSSSVDIPAATISGPEESQSSSLPPPTLRDLSHHLLFTQRFRNQSFGGEESYCLINLMANIDLGALGVGRNTADLTPIPITRQNMALDTPVTIQGDSLRGRVGQGVDAITGSANKVISGVVDSSFGVLRALLPGQTTTTTAPVVGPVDSDPALWSVHPGLGLLRRESGFSIAGFTASLPGQGRVKAVGNAEDDGQRELVEVTSRPPSLKSDKNGDEAASESEETDDDSESDREDSGEDEDVHDARSIKSFESMLSSVKTKRQIQETQSRQSLTGRLTHGLSRRPQSDVSQVSRHQSLPPASRVDGLMSFPTPSPMMSIRLPRPNRRLLECTEQDIKVSEVGELLREYRRLVEAVHSIGGFDQ